MIEQPPAIPAAAIIALRQGASAMPEILFIRRSATLAFAAGAYAFPGGRIDPADRALATTLGFGVDAEDAVARLAAIREVLEETGVPVGHVPPPSREAVAAWRAGEEGILPVPGGSQLALDGLVPFARWRPDEHVVRRFDTHFYLAEAAEGFDPLPDGGEIDEAFWATAEQVLARCEAGDGRALFPTRRLLNRLARFRSFAEARADALSRPARIISPWVERRGESDWLCIPEDAGYPICAEPVETGMRY